jgi:hypothetical protein
LWDPVQANYRDADNNLLTEGDIRALLGRFLERQRGRAEAATRQLTTGELTVPEWETEMRWIIKNSVGAAYMLGRGGRNAMEIRDWGRVGRMAASQYRFLNQFAAQLVAGSVSEGRAIARAMLYPLSAKQAQSSGYTRAIGGPDLPAYPGDGSTQCLGNCLCSWSLEQTTLADGAAGWNAYWRDQRGPNECDDCLRRGQEWNPLVVRV